MNSLVRGEMEKHHGRVKYLRLLLFFIAMGLASAGPLPLRVVAANLTSENAQAYSPDHGNHSNSGGAGARILEALKPDIVLIQEFNTTIPMRQWVNLTFGENYQFVREEGMQIPNGIISRFPIIRSGVWDDPVLSNRDFVWAKIRLPGGQELWAVSVHFHTKNAASRDRQSAALVSFIRRDIPAGAWLFIGGDLNTRHTEEPCFERLACVVIIPPTPPADAHGIIHTNAPRNRPYDWVLASAPLQRLEIPVKLAGREFARGLVFDSRVFEPLDALPPVQKSDSGVKNMQHMAVVRDFLIP